MITFKFVWYECSLFVFTFQNKLLNLQLYTEKKRSTCKVLRKLSYNE